MARTCFYKGRGLRPAIIEKDYYVTEPLRELALTASDHFAYKQRAAATGDVRNRVLLEAGIASGREPTAKRPLTSYLAQFLAETSASLGATDEQPFKMNFLHFRRTFVEKLFAIHGKQERRHLPSPESSRPARRRLHRTVSPTLLWPADDVG